MARLEPLRAGALLIATRNPSKAAELQPAFEAAGFRLIDLGAAGVARNADEENIEVYETFEENALAKARYYAAASGGLPTAADDSGLVVDALGGEPGVRSRRWSGVDGSEAVVSAANNAKLLARLPPGVAREARFVCAVAVVAGDRAIVVRGEARGRIARAPRGTQGFGYDPLFESAELGWRTFAESTAEEKRAVGHRGRAVALAVERLAELRSRVPG